MVMAPTESLAYVDNGQPPFSALLTPFSASAWQKQQNERDFCQIEKGKSCHAHYLLLVVAVALHLIGASIHLPMLVCAKPTKHGVQTATQRPGPLTGHITARLAWLLAVPPCRECATVSFSAVLAPSGQALAPKQSIPPWSAGPSLAVACCA